MPRGSAAFVLSAVALFGQAQPRDNPAPTTGTSVIRGRVIASDGTPVRKARVALTSEAGSLDPVYSDAVGRFEFASLPAGRYVLSAAKAGFVFTRLGARNYLDRHSPVDVAAGAIVDGIDVRLPRAGAITGRVVDSFGDPIVAAWVSAGMLVTAGIGPHIQPVTPSPAETDDLGEYRIGGLAAGRYIVSASTEPGITSPPAGLGWAKSYYPGGSRLSQAAPVGVSAGGDSSGIDFAFTATRMPKLSISAQDALGNAIGGTAILMLTDGTGDSRATRVVRFTVGMKPSPALESGDWVAVFRAPEGDAIAHLTIGGDDASVNFVAAKASRMAGRIAFDSANPPPPSSSFTVGVRGIGIDASIPPSQSFGGSTPGKVKADGMFEIDDILGAVEPYLVTPPRGWTLKSAMHNGRSLLDAPVEFKGGEEITGVEIVLTNRVSEIAGLAVDEQNQPANGCSVIIFPESRGLLRNQARWARWERTDQNGRFVAAGLPAGAYLAIAIADVDPSVWSTAEYLDRFRPQAAGVALGDGDKRKLTLECVTP